MDIELNEKPAVLTHKVLYDFRLIKKVLEENGFGNVARYDWEDFLPQGAEDHSAAYIPSKDYNHGILVSLNVQAEKIGEVKHKFLKMKNMGVDIQRKIIKKLWRKFF